MFRIFIWYDSRLFQRRQCFATVSYREFEWVFVKSPMVEINSMLCFAGVLYLKQWSLSWDPSRYLVSSSSNCVISESNWRRVSLTVCLTGKSARFSFVAKLSSPKQRMAVDDIVLHGENDPNDVRPGRCAWVSCSFEDGHHCGWKDVASPFLPWKSSVDHEPTPPGSRSAFMAVFAGKEVARTLTEWAVLSAPTELSIRYLTTTTVMSSLIRVSMQYWESENQTVIVEFSNANGTEIRNAQKLSHSKSQSHRETHKKRFSQHGLIFHIKKLITDNDSWK